MAYTAEGPKRPNSEELRARIPGWGADLNPDDRPSVPKLKYESTGAHWDFPDRQPEKWPRERSNEHKFLTPVFGTSTPPRGLSGRLRRVAYKYSEGRAAHWLLLIAADRVNSAEAQLLSLLMAHPDNPFTETGIKSEFTHHGFSSRFGTKRADRTHMWIDPILVGGPYLALAAGAIIVARRIPGRG